MVVAFLAQGFEVEIAADRLSILGAGGKTMSLRRTSNPRFSQNEPLAVLRNDAVLFVGFREGDVEMSIEVLGSGRFIATRSDLSRWARVEETISGSSTDELIAAVAATDIKALYQSLKKQPGTCRRGRDESGVVAGVPNRLASQNVHGRRRHRPR